MQVMTRLKYMLTRAHTHAQKEKERERERGGERRERESERERETGEQVFISFLYFLVSFYIIKLHSHIIFIIISVIFHVYFIYFYYILFTTVFILLCVCMSACEHIF